MQKQISTKAAKKLGDFAKDFAKKTVGKSIPYFMHEVKVPDELKQK